MDLLGVGPIGPISTGAHASLPEAHPVTQGWLYPRDRDALGQAAWSLPQPQNPLAMIVMWWLYGERDGIRPPPKDRERKGMHLRASMAWMGLAFAPLDCMHLLRSGGGCLVRATGRVGQQCASGAR